MPTLERTIMKKTQTSQIAEGLMIVEKYLREGEDYSIGAEHDIIYAGYDMVSKMSPEDQQKMKDLGWHETDVDSWGFYT